MSSLSGAMNIIGVKCSMANIHRDKFGKIILKQKTDDGIDFNKVCYLPFHGITIDSQGLICLCCMEDISNSSGERFIPRVHIDEVDDLEEYWRSEFPKIWDLHLAGKATTFHPCNLCFDGCQRKAYNTVQEQYALQLKEGRINWEWDPNNPKIKFLEFTTSNICNQMCIMCSSRHSNKWGKYEKFFGRHDQGLIKMSDISIKKIKKILPNLSEMMLKGGEFFADPTNLDLLEYCAEVNPQCKISSATNMQKITKRHLNVMSKFDRINLSVSIDGTNKIYDWIRGGNFQKTVDNMKRVQDVGVRVNVNITISIYNFFNLFDIIEYFSHPSLDCHINCKNIVHWPTWCSVYSLPKDVVENQMQKYFTIMGDAIKANNFRFLNNLGVPNFFEGELDGYNDILPDWEKIKPKVIEYTNQMNKIRGFDILDYIPQLKSLINN